MSVQSLREAKLQTLYSLIRHDGSAVEWVGTHGKGRCWKSTTSENGAYPYRLRVWSMYPTPAYLYYKQ